MKQEIIDCFTWYANKVAETVQYESWSDEFCRKENEVNTHIFLEELNEHIVYSDHTPNLFLIPLYILPILPIGTELVSINGNRIIYDGSNVDKDTRYGCLAFGIVIEDN